MISCSDEHEVIVEGGGPRPRGGTLRPPVWICFRTHWAYFFRGAKGGNSPVGKTQARDPTAKPEVSRGLLGKGDLGPAVGAILMRTTCIRGAPRIYDTRVIIVGGIVH